MVFKHMKMCSFSRLIKEMQISQPQDWQKFKARLYNLLVRPWENSHPHIFIVEIQKYHPSGGEYARVL